MSLSPSLPIAFKILLHIIYCGVLGIWIAWLPCEDSSHNNIGQFLVWGQISPVITEDYFSFKGPILLTM